VEPSLLDIEIAPGSSLAIVGDVHGQFADLVHHILPQKGPNRQFLFLGDYVDRGPQSLETIVLLLALKVTYPKHVYLLRGNHEEAQTSRIYGFYSEAVQKYEVNGTEVWSRVNEVFCHIPIAAVVSANEGRKRVFCAHGGLSPDLTDLQRVRSIDRVDYGATLDNTSAGIMDGLLWSDPITEGSSLRFRPNERGCGFVFGPVATQEFCSENKIAFVIRAHQMAMEGYNWSHSNLCLTVFSAPNYCGISNNLGAVLLMNDGLEASFVQYKSAPGKSHVGPPAPMSLPPFFFR
jgi:serine/threonine-protein phosphatase 2A catalytic subunit